MKFFSWRTCKVHSCDKHFTGLIIHITDSCVSHPHLSLDSVLLDLNPGGLHNGSQKATKPRPEAAFEPSTITHLLWTDRQWAALRGCDNGLLQQVYREGTVSCKRPDVKRFLHFFLVLTCQGSVSSQRAVKTTFHNFLDSLSSLMTDAQWKMLFRALQGMLLNSDYAVLNLHPR